MRLFRRRSSDPNPELVSLSRLDLDNSSAGKRDDNDLSSSITKNGFDGKTEKSKNIDYSEIPSTRCKNKSWKWSPQSIHELSSSPRPRRISRVESLKNLFSRADKSDKSSDTENDHKSDSEGQARAYALPTSEEQKQKRVVRTKKRYRSTAENLKLTDNQLIDYLFIIQPKDEDLRQMVNDFNERDINRSPKINKLPSVSEDNQTNQKTSGRFKVKNIFSRKSSSKSDDEGETVKKRPISSGSLSNLTELANTKKILSLSEISSAFTSMLSKHDDSHNKSTDSVINYPKSPSNRENDDKSCDKTLTPIKPEDNPLNGSMEIDTETYKRYRFHYETDTSDEKDNSPKTSKTGTIKKLQALISPKMKRQHEDNSNNDSDQSLLKSKNKLSKSDTQKESFEELNRNLKPNLENLILEFTPILPKKSPSTDKEFKCVRLRMVEGDIGLSIAPSKALHNNSFCYIITDIAPASIAARNGALSIGDEVVKLNGTRLRGTKPDVAKSLLVPVDGEVEIVIAKTKSNGEIRTETPSEDVQFRKKYTQHIEESPPSKYTAVAPESIFQFGKESFGNKYNLMNTENTKKLDQQQYVQLPGSKPRVTFNEHDNRIIPIEEMNESDASKNSESQSDEAYTPTMISNEKENRITPIEKIRESNASNTLSRQLTKKVHKPRMVSNDGRVTPLEEITELNTSQSSLKSPDTSNEAHGMMKFSCKPTTCGERRASVASMLQVGEYAGVRNRYRLLKVTFEKGPEVKCMGFSIVGGIDSPKGAIGIYVKTIFKEGQAADTAVLKERDEILSVNGCSLKGLTHREALRVFKNIKSGDVHMEILRDCHYQRRSDSI